MKKHKPSRCCGSGLYPAMTMRLDKVQQKRIAALSRSQRRQLPHFLRRSLDTTLEHFERVA